MQRLSLVKRRAPGFDHERAEVGAVLLDASTIAVSE